MNPVTLPPGRGKLATKPEPTGSVALAKMMGMVRVCCSSAAVVGVLDERTSSGLQRDKFLRESLHRLLVGRRPTKVDPDVATLCPPELLESLPERGEEALSFPITFGKRHQHADASHPISLLLRAPRERPRRRAAEQRDELASFHSITSSARASRVSGTVRPNALAVLRLMINSNLIGCWTGRSAGLTPFSTRST